MAVVLHTVKIKNQEVKFWIDAEKYDKQLKFQAKRQKYWWQYFKPKHTFIARAREEARRDLKYVYVHITPKTIKTAMIDIKTGIVYKLDGLSKCTYEVYKNAVIIKYLTTFDL